MSRHQKKPERAGHLVARRTVDVSLETWLSPAARRSSSDISAVSVGCVPDRGYNGDQPAGRCRLNRNRPGRSCCPRLPETRPSKLKPLIESADWAISYISTLITTWVASARFLCRTHWSMRCRTGGVYRHDSQFSCLAAQGCAADPVREATVTVASSCDQKSEVSRLMRTWSLACKSEPPPVAVAVPDRPTVACQVATVGGA